MDNYTILEQGFYYPFFDRNRTKILNAFIYKYFLKANTKDLWEQFDKKIRDYIAQRRYRRLIILYKMALSKFMEIWAELNIFGGYEFIDNFLNDKGGLESSYYNSKIYHFQTYAKYFDKVFAGECPSLHYIYELKKAFRLPKTSGWDDYPCYGCIGLIATRGNRAQNIIDL